MAYRVMAGAAGSGVGDDPAVVCKKPLHHLLGLHVGIREREDTSAASGDHASFVLEREAVFGEDDPAVLSHVRNPGDIFDPFVLAAWEDYEHWVDGPSC